MRYFTAKEVLIATAFVVWTVALMVFLKSDKTVGDLAVNLLTDIAFAVFLALYIEHVNSKERLRANRARQRAVALAVQGFFQTYYRFLEALIGDAIQSAKPTSLPSMEEIRAMAAKKNAQTDVRADFWDQPTPYCAFLLCGYTGETVARVFPPRPTHQYLAELAARIDPQYRDIFSVDNDLIPDHVVDALTSLKRHHLIAVSQHGIGRPVRFDYWIEIDLEEIFALLATLQLFFAPSLGLTRWSSDTALKDLVINAFNRQGIKLSRY